MSIEAQARSASAELRVSVAHHVDTSGARALLDHRRLMRRVETAIFVAFGIVVLSGSAVLLEQSSSQEALPASVPLVDQGARPARECLFVSCANGVYRAALSVPLTFAPQGVVSVSSDSPDALVLTDDFGLHDLTVVANPTPMNDSRVGNRLGGSMGTGTATSVAASLSARSDLEVSPGLNVTLAGRPGIQLDITAAHVDDTPALFTSGNSGTQPIALERDQTIRLTLVDVPGSGTVAVVLQGWTDGKSAPSVSAWRLEPVLASLAFGAG